MTVSHPSSAQLRAFALGTLPAGDCESLEQHLEQCAECGRCFDALDLAIDPLVSLLRHTSPEDSTLAPAAALPQSDRTSMRFGPYQVLEKLGEGGMGLVYRAKDSRLGREVAIKVIKSRYSAGAVDRIRFRRESAAAARLQHANIVQIFDFVEDQGVPYFAMELVTGGSLAERLRRGTLPPDDAAQLVATLADASEYAHRQQVVHRDLKPGNILFTKEGATPKIADFGLAKILDEDTSQTATGEVLGSPSYMAPEQARGEREIGPATDIHALGVILYESLTGRSPFRSDNNLTTLELVKNFEPQIADSSLRRVNRDLAMICLKCLRKEPAARYASAAELANDLRRFLARVPVKARKPTWLERTVRAIRRNSVVTGLLGIIFVLLISAAIILSAALRQSRAQTETLQRQIFASQLREAQGMIQEKPQQAQELLRDASLCPHRLRDFTWQFLDGRSDLQLGSWPAGAPVIALAIAPNGSFVATGDDSGNVRIWKVLGEPTTRVLDLHRGPITDLAVNSKSDRLAVACEDGDVTVSSISEVTRSLRISVPETRANGVAFSSQKDILATAHSDGILRIWDASTGAPRHEWPAHGDSILRIEFNADGSLLASCSRDGPLKIWTTDDWQEQQTWQGGEGYVTAMQFHPTQTKVLAFATSARGMKLWRVFDDAPADLIVSGGGFKANVAALAFSDNGKRLAAGSYDRSIQVWQGEPFQPQATFRDHDSEIFGLVFDPQEQLVVGTKAGNLIRWKKTDGLLSPHVVATLSDGVSGLCYGNQGSALVSSGYDGEIRAWNGSTAKLLATHRHPQDWATHLTSDGTQLAWAAGGKIWTAALLPDQSLKITPVPGEPILPRALLAFSANQVIVADASAVRCFNLPEGSSAWEVPATEATLLAGDLQADRLVIATANRRWWSGSPTTGRGVWHSLESDLRSVALNPAGTQVAMGNSQGSTSILTPSGKTVLKLSGHSGPVTAVAYSRDGLTLATAGDDGEIRLWDPIVGALRGRLDAQSSIRQLAFRPDSRELLCGTERGEILTFNPVGP